MAYDHSPPIRGQCLGHVMTLDQSEASIPSVADVKYTQAFPVIVQESVIAVMTSHSQHKHVIYFMNIEYQYHIGIIKANQKYLHQKINEMLCLMLKFSNKTRPEFCRKWHDMNSKHRGEQGYV